MPRLQAPSSVRIAIRPTQDHSRSPASSRLRSCHMALGFATPTGRGSGDIAQPASSIARISKLKCHRSKALPDGYSGLARLLPKPTKPRIGKAKLIFVKLVLICKAEREINKILQFPIMLQRGHPPTRLYVEPSNRIPNRKSPRKSDPFVRMPDKSGL